MIWQVNNMYINLGMKYIGHSPRFLRADNSEMECEYYYLQKWNNFRKSTKQKFIKNKL